MTATTGILSPLDATFLWTESDSNLTHVGGFTLVRPPADAPTDYVARTVAEYRQWRTPVAPFNRTPAPGLVNWALPRWQTVERIDTDYHVQLHTLTGAGDTAELTALIARLHSERLDRHQPMWQMHIIEGLADGRFALFMKIHHSLADGVTIVRLTKRWMSEDPHTRGTAPLWAHQRPRAARPARTTATPPATNPVKAVGAVAAGLARMYSHLLPRVGGDPALTHPFAAPWSTLNRPITNTRAIATLAFDTGQLQQVAQRADCTVNDVFLAMCAGALREHLAAAGTLPDRPLTAAVPMSFHPADGGRDGNDISFALATLATDTADPARRLAAITASTEAAKAHMHKLPTAAVAGYTATFMLPFVLGMLTRTGGRTPPMFNLIVSNVPGPARRLFHNGAELDEWYPVSVPSTGHALNITTLSYAGRMHVCLTADPTVVPDLDALAAGFTRALAELG